MSAARIVKHARKVVRTADRDGSLDRGELTMHKARQLVCESMGLSSDAADDDRELRDAIKQAVRDAMAELEEGEEGNGDEAEDVVEAADDSEVESQDDRPTTSKQASPAKKSAKTKPTLASKAAAKAHKSVETIDDSDEGGQQPPLSPSSSMSSVYDEPPKPRAKSKSSKRASSSKRTTPSARSRSGSLSSVIDEPAPKKKRTKSKKDPNEGLSPEEARVADLKRIVVACGVRKQWGKELADCPTPKSQIAHLQDLLRSLGMKGQPTLGKAKSLRERRELAQEINDVKEYEAERGLSAQGRPKRRRVDSDEGERKAASDGAMAAVLGFLGEDSD